MSKLEVALCTRLNYCFRANLTETVPFVFFMSLYLFLLPFNPHILGCRGGMSVKKVLVELQIEM